MKIDLNRKSVPDNVPALCPHCGHNATFEQVGVEDNCSTDNRFGIRRCPRNSCKGYLFIVTDSGMNVVKTFPSITIDFNSSDIPDNVAKCLKEAIECHANDNEIAAAIMVRKTLEELCHDKDAKGKDLKERIQDLGGQILIPESLLNGMDKLRLLGNDAAHVEARVFVEIGKKEVEVAINFAKKVLEATYQYDALLAELDGLSEQNEK